MSLVNHTLLFVDPVTGTYTQVYSIINYRDIGCGFYKEYEYILTKRSLTISPPGFGQRSIDINSRNSCTYCEILPMRCILDKNVYNMQLKFKFYYPKCSAITSKVTFSLVK